MITPAKVTLRHLLTQHSERLGFTAVAIDTLVAESQITSWREGATIVGPEDGHDLLNFIVAGVVKVVCPLTTDRRLIVQFSKGGQFIHTGWLFESRPRTRKFAAIAHTPVTVAVMSQAVVTRVIQSLPPPRALRLTTYGLRALSSLLYEKCLLLGKPLYDCVVHELQVLARDFGRAHARGILIDLSLTHEDLAQLVAGSRARVSECFERLVKTGQLEVLDHKWLLKRRLLPSGGCL
jgi:CRP/FNR family cyclic AMP-dependent transcriptional regulator